MSQVPTETFTSTNKVQIKERERESPFFFSIQLTEGNYLIKTVCDV